VTGLAELEGLNPFDILDREAERLDRFLSALDDDRWAVASRCDGWTIRDVLAHLASAEGYHNACLDDDLDAFLQRGADAGATDLDAFNEWGIREYDGRSPEQVLAEWRGANEQTRRRMRDRGDGTMTTMVPDYPVRLQAFHVASELATHADDVGVPVDPEEAGERTGWRARFSRFAVAEMERDVSISPSEHGNVVRAGDVEVVLSDDDLIEAVAARLPTGHSLAPELRVALSTMP